MGTERTSKMPNKEAAWRLFILIVETALLCESRIVKVPAGPLVRVEGQSVSISCNVTDYEGPPEQDFDWSFIVNGKETALISTFDLTFPDKTVLDRINSGEISVTKLKNNEAVLTINKVRASDSTIYRCTTPSTDSVIKGNYFADVELNVIGDSLKVVPVIPQPTVSEGKSLEVRCNVTRAYTAHTVLSVTVSIRKNGNLLEEILTFGPDNEMKFGQGFAQRYTDGGLLLNLNGAGVYGLTLKGMRPQDQGTYICTAREWTRQPGGGKGWQKILERSEDMGNVTVTPLARSLVVSVEKNVTLNVADSLNLTCTVAADGLPDVRIEVIWLVASENTPTSQRVLLHIGRDGQVLDGSELASMSRLQLGTFRLFLPKVQASDSGLYSCRVKCWLSQGTGGWYSAAEKTSDSVKVLIAQLEPEFKISLTAPLIPQFTADPTELLCEASELLNLQDGSLGVNWFYTKNTPGDVSESATSIVSLNEQGVLLPGAVYQQRLSKGEISVTHSAPNTFKLRLLHTEDVDMGQYSCSIAAWTRGRQGVWNKAKELKSTPVSVHWTAKVPVVSVVAHRVREASTGGSTFEMTCQVSGQNLQNPSYSVLIRFQEPGVGKTRKVISMSMDSVLQLEEGMGPSRADSVALEKTGQLEYRFRLYGAQVSDQGSYYCDVTAWTRNPSNDWNKAASAESTKIDIHFSETGPVFSVSINPESIRILPGEMAKMECIMNIHGAVPNMGDVNYEVHWYQSSSPSLENSNAIISMDRWGVVKKQNGNESTQCSLERTDKNIFTLTVQRAKESDAAEYFCKVKPWYLSTATGVWSEGNELSSNPILLSIQIQLWDSVKMPIFYGIAAALGVGLLSILLGITAANCCFSKNLMHTPRNKLIDLEMD